MCSTGRRGKLRKFVGTSLAKIELPTMTDMHTNSNPQRSPMGFELEASMYMLASMNKFPVFNLLLEFAIICNYC